VSIFTRDCPVCAAQHPVHAARCGCGYVFDPNKLDGVTQELEVISQEEKLYSDYLSARADQAEEAARVARQLATRDPGNTVKAADALLAEQTALAARSEYNAQNSRAHAVSARVKVVRASRRSRRVAKQAADRTKKPKPASVHAALAPAAPVAAAPTPKPAPIAIASAPKPVAQPVAAKPAPKPTAAVQAAPAAKPAPAAPPVVVRKSQPQKAAPKPVMMPAPIAKPAPVPAPVIEATKPHTPPPLVAVPAPSAPSRPAATVLKPVTPPAALPNAAESPLTFDRPTPAFKATQASRAEEVHSITARSTHECPNCTATIKPNTKRCGCGFELVSTENQIPALSLSPEEQAAFMAALTPSAPRNKG
jgi:hypothetical protein